MTIYDRIRQRRISLNMSQEDLALALGYKDRSMITKIESGKVDISQKKIIAFAKVLLTTPAYLMGWEGDTPSTVIADNNEEHLVLTYRSLPTKGKEYLLQQAQVAQVLYGEKSDPVSNPHVG